MVQPRCWYSPILARRWNDSSPTARTSSTSRMSGSTWTATANPRRVLAGAVVLHLVVDERLELGEGDDVVEVALSLAAAQAEDGRVQEDVLAAGQLAVEAGPELQQRGDPPRTATVPVVGARMPDSTFRSVDLPEPLGPISPTVWPAPISRSTSRRAQNASELDSAVEQQPLLEAGGPLVVEQEALADPGGDDRRAGHYSSSAKSAWRRRKVQMPRASRVTETAAATPSHWR